MVHIRDTMNLEQIEISEAMLAEAEASEHIEVLSQPEDWKFNEEGNLW